MTNLLQCADRRNQEFRTGSRCARNQQVSWCKIPVRMAAGAQPKLRRSRRTPLSRWRLTGARWAGQIRGAERRGPHVRESAVSEHRLQRLSPSRAAGGRRGIDPGRAGDAVRRISAAVLAAGDPRPRTGRAAAAAAHPRRGSGRVPRQERRRRAPGTALPASRHLARIRADRRHGHSLLLSRLAVRLSTARSSKPRASRPTAR